MKIGCVVLAAGNARRFGSNKLKAEVDGESLIHRALEAVPSGLVTVLSGIISFKESSRRSIGSVQST